MPVDLTKLKGLADTYANADEAYKKSENDADKAFRNKKEAYSTNLKKLDLNGWLVQSRLARMIRDAVTKVGLSREQKGLTDTKMFKKAKEGALKKAPTNIFGAVIHAVKNGILFVTSFLFRIERLDVKKNNMQTAMGEYASALIKAKHEGETYTQKADTKRAFKRFVMKAFAEGKTVMELQKAIKGEPVEGQEENKRALQKLDYYAAKFTRSQGYFPFYGRVDATKARIESTAASICQRLTSRTRPTPGTM